MGIEQLNQGNNFISAFDFHPIVVVNIVAVFAFNLINYEFIQRLHFWPTIFVRPKTKNGKCSHAEGCGMHRLFRCQNKLMPTESQFVVLIFFFDSFFFSCQTSNKALCPYLLALVVIISNSPPLFVRTATNISIECYTMPFE